MIRTPGSAVLALALCAALPAFANPADEKKAPEMTAEQKAMMEAYQAAGTPGAAHAALAKTAGTYDIEVTSWEAPDAPPTKEKGVAKRSMSLDGRVLVEQVESTMHGQPWNGHGMHGYDNVSGRHWSTWNDSMSTGLMVSEGECDVSMSCKFTGSWNDPISKGKINARMTTRWTDANTEVFEMYTPGPDGKEMKMMEITYRKRGK
jgi:hypothetical protein